NNNNNNNIIIIIIIITIKMGKISTGELSTFFHFIQYEYMIKAVFFVIRSIMNFNDPLKILPQVDKMGKFPGMRVNWIMPLFIKKKRKKREEEEHINKNCGPCGDVCNIVLRNIISKMLTIYITIVAVLQFESGGENNLKDLYETVLIETPIGKYFEKFLESQNILAKRDGMETFQRIFNEEDIDLITNTVLKYWLEDFYRYCQGLDGDTATIMKELLEFEADKRAILVMIHTNNTELNQIARQKERQR
ncbi:hypothetical protein RFI_14874, partial [Reticulomyxa filosa]